MVRICVFCDLSENTQAVPASSSCRLTYLKLKAFASESVSFASESVSIPCELQLFRSVALPCPSYAVSGQGGQVTLGPLVCFGSGAQGHAKTPLQGLAVLSFLHEPHCCQYKRWNSLHPKAKHAQGCLRISAWHRPRFAGLTAGGSPASWPGITAAYLIEPVCSFN